MKSLTFAVVFFTSFSSLSENSVSALSSRNGIRDKFQQANQYYQSGDFQNAKVQYEEILKNDISNFAVHYNLGNSYYQCGEQGKAIRHWLIAWRLKPRDLDVRHNLALVSTKIGEPLFFENVFLRGFQFIFYLLDLNELSILLSLVLWGLCFLWIVSLLKERVFLKSKKNLVFLIIFILIGIWWIARYYKEEIKVLAVITVPKTEVRSGPGKQFRVGFTIPEGRRVVVLKQEDHSEWTEIGVPREGLKGWMKTEELALVR